MAFQYRKVLETIANNAVEYSYDKMSSGEDTQGENRPSQTMQEYLNDTGLGVRIIDNNFVNYKGLQLVTLGKDSKIELCKNPKNETFDLRYFNINGEAKSVSVSRENLPYVACVIETLGAVDYSDESSVQDFFNDLATLPNEFFGIGKKEEVDRAINCLSAVLPVVFESSYAEELEEIAMESYTNKLLHREIYEEMKLSFDLYASMFIKSFPSIFKRFSEDIQEYRMKIYYADQSFSDALGSFKDSLGECSLGE